MDAWIDELVEQEKIPYKVISLTKRKENILDEIKQLCLAGLPPFEDSTDKGFKEAYIYFTILEYLSSIKDGNLFIVTRDERLKMALEKHRRIKVVKDYEEFKSYDTEYFKSQYFIGRLKEAVDETIEASGINAIYLNIDKNWVLRVSIDGNKTYLIEVDFRSREIIDFTDEDYKDDINELINSPNFATTHACVNSLEGKINYFSDDDILNL
jgi:hypothetical protein